MRAVRKLVPVPKPSSNGDVAENIPVEKARLHVTKTTQKYISKYVFPVIMQPDIKVHRNLEEDCFHVLQGSTPGNFVRQLRETTKFVTK
jgi:hypothetical protein